MSKVFVAKWYHHLNKGGHVDYLRHLRKVVKPTGRLCVIEKHAVRNTRVMVRGVGVDTPGCRGFYLSRRRKRGGYPFGMS